MATIVDVANAAKVSVATVSRVLNNSNVVTEEKKQRVFEAIEAVGYQIPSRMKINQQLSSSRNTILVIASSLIENILFPLQKSLEELGYLVLIRSHVSQKQRDSLKELLNTLEPNLAGIVLLNSVDTFTEFYDFFSKYPLVQIGDPIEENPSNITVNVDEIKLSRDAANYLIEQGRKNIAILMPDASKLFFSKKRLEGYYLALLEHRIPIDEQLIVSTDLTVDGSFDDVKQLLERRPDIDAILGCVDVVAMGALYAIFAAGKSQKDVLVMAMDESDHWNCIPGGLPYIDLHPDEIGNTAASVLHSVICGDLPSNYHIIVQHSLVTPSNE